MNGSSKSFVAVEARVLPSSESQPSVSSENVAPVIISWPANMAPKLRPKSNVTTGNNKCVPRCNVPGVPLRSRKDSSTIGQAQQFSSTTYVNAAMKDESVPIKLEAPDETYFNSEFVYMEDKTTIEVPVETLVSDNNEIQTINVGKFTNLTCAHGVEPSNTDPLLTSSDSAGVYYVTLKEPNIDTETKENDDCEPVIPATITHSLPNSRGSRYPKRSIIMNRRTRMIADLHTNISVREFKVQLNDTTDTVSSMEIAPPTKKYMHALNTRGVNKLFANPGRSISASLSKCFTRHLTMKQIKKPQTFGDLKLPPLVAAANVHQSKTNPNSSKRGQPEAEERRHKTLKRYVVSSADLLHGAMLTEDLILVGEPSPDISEEEVKQVATNPKKKKISEDKGGKQVEHLTLETDPLADVNKDDSFGNNTSSSSAEVFSEIDIPQEVVAQTKKRQPSQQRGRSGAGRQPKPVMKLLDSKSVLVKGLDEGDPTKITYIGWKSYPPKAKQYLSPKQKVMGFNSESDQEENDSMVILVPDKLHSKLGDVHMQAEEEHGTSSKSIQKAIVHQPNLPNSPQDSEGEEWL